MDISREFLAAISGYTHATVTHICQASEYEPAHGRDVGLRVSLRLSLPIVNAVLSSDVTVAWIASLDCSPCQRARTEASAHTSPFDRISK